MQLIELPETEKLRESTGTPSVAVITDANNKAAWENLNSRSFNDGANFMLEVKEPLAAFCSSAKINEQLQGHPVAIVALGVEGRRDYHQRIATLLDAWRNLNVEGKTRPVLLLVSSDRKYAETAIKEWGENIPNWQEQSKAIVICQNLVEKKPEEFIQILNKALKEEHDMRNLLSMPLSQGSPSTTVAQPVIKHNASVLAIKDGHAKN